MKKTIGILMLLGTFLTYSQEYKSSIGMSGGYTTNGFGGIVEYNHHFGKKSAINSSIYYSSSKYKEDLIDVNYSDITLNVGYYYKVLDQEYGRFLVLLGGGGLVGHEILNNGKETLDNGFGIDGESKIIYGAYLGANFNYFISDYFALSLVLNEFYHDNSDIGNLAFYGGIGIKYYVF